MKVRATPKLIGYLAIWALSLLPAFLSGGLAGWLPFCTLGMCGLLSLLQLLWLRGRLEQAVSLMVVWRLVNLVWIWHKKLQMPYLKEVRFWGIALPELEVVFKVL